MESLSSLFFLFIFLVWPGNFVRCASTASSLSLLVFAYGVLLWRKIKGKKKGNGEKAKILSWAVIAVTIEPCTNVTFACEGNGGPIFVCGGIFCFCVRKCSQRGNDGRYCASDSVFCSDHLCCEGEEGQRLI